MHEVNSAVPAGQVTAQDPKAGTQVVIDTSVRINVSKGPQPITVPDVDRRRRSTPATSTLQARASRSARRSSTRTQPTNTVISQSPGGSSTAAKGSTVSLTVSKGPKTTQVPDVTNLEISTATAEIQASEPQGAASSTSDVTDPSQDGIVQSQNPTGGSTAAIGSTVTINVGRFVATTTSTTPPTP